MPSSQWACTWGADAVARLSIRGNLPVLFLLFFGLTTLLGGAMARAYDAYVGEGGTLGYGLVTAASAAGFAFSLAIVARIVYKASG